MDEATREIILFLITAVLAVLTIINFALARRGDAKKEGSTQGEIMNGIISIQDKLVDLKSDMSDVKTTQNKHEIKIAKLEVKVENLENMNGGENCERIH